MPVKEGVGFWYTDVVPGSSTINGVPEQKAVSFLDPNRMPMLKFGLNGDVDVAAQEDVWNVTTQAQLIHLNSAETINISSSSASDTFDLDVTGVADDWSLQTDTITLNGTTPVPTNIPFKDIWRMNAVDESLVVNVGIITALDSLTNIQAQIATGDGQTSMSHFTVPLGWSGFVYGISKLCGRNDSAIIETQVSRDGGAFKVFSEEFVTDSGLTENYNPYPLFIPEKTRVRFVTQAIGNNTSVSVKYRAILVRNEVFA